MWKEVLIWWRKDRDHVLGKQWPKGESQEQSVVGEGANDSLEVGSHLELVVQILFDLCEAFWL